MQLDGFFRILVTDDLEWNWNLDANAQFFVQFPLQAFLETFSVFAFSAGKLPEAGKMYAGAALGDEITAVTTDQAGGYFDDFCHDAFPRALNGNVLQIGVMGHASQVGVRAVQQIAPKSIRA